MSRGLHAAVAAGLGFAVLAWSGQASANITVFGGGFAEGCSKSARAAADSRPRHSEAVHECDLALDTELLSTHDTAATHVNRGVLYLASSDFTKALRDFEAAASLEPELGEAYVNWGAALIGQGHEAEGIASIDRGLALQTDEPEKAYFNRALAKERLNDLKGAYFDYQKALELKPDWDMPKLELARFTVTQR